MSDVKDPTKEEDLAVDELQDGTAVVDLPGEDDTAAAAAGADERLTTSSDEVDDEDPAQAANELNSARTEQEREAIRERRRKERHDKKEARLAREREKDERLANLEQTVRLQAEQLGLIQNRNRGTELAQLDAAIKRTQDAENYYKGIISDAVTQQNGAVVADATARLLAVGREQENLVNVRKTFAQAQTRPAPTQPIDAQQPDPEMLKHTVAWMNENKWYNPRGNDPETQLVKALDGAVFAEGFKPNTSEYWTELSKRVAANLPHRAKESRLPTDTSRKSEQRSVVTGSGRSSAAANGGSKTTFVLSADRVKALKDAGMWEDTKSRSDAIRRFRDYDREHAAETR